MMGPGFRICAGVGLVLALCGPATAQWQGVRTNQDLVAVTGGFGLSYLRGNEFVYSNSKKLSQLVWEGMAVPTASASVMAPLENGWRVRLSGEAGLSGGGYMTDYDWDPAHTVSTARDDWSDRSLHPDTQVDHYFSGGLRVGRDVVQEPGLRAGFHGELGYTDVQWTAFGGSYIYSNGGFRNDTGTIPAGDAAVTYRQMWPMLLAGADAAVTDGAWHASAAVQGGMAFLARSEDDHWLRDLRFLDSFTAGPVLGAEGNVSYSFSEKSELFASASARKVFTQVGDTEEVETDTNTSRFLSGTAGADFLSVSVRAGLRGRF